MAVHILSVPQLLYTMAEWLLVTIWISVDGEVWMLGLWPMTKSISNLLDVIQQDGVIHHHHCLEGAIVKRYYYLLASWKLPNAWNILWWEMDAQ